MKIADVEPFTGDLILQVFYEDQERILIERQVVSVDGEVIFTDPLLQIGVQYFGRFYTRANNFESERTDFFSIVVVSAQDTRITEAGDTRITEAGDTRVTEAA